VVAIMSSDSTKDLIRESLREHAAEVQSDLDFASAARTQAGRRRRSRFALLVAGGLAVIVVAVAVTWTSDRQPLGVSGPTPTNERPFKGVDIHDWRYESYRGVELRVPPSWGWGATPPSRNRQCGPFFDERAQAFHNSIFDVGYVARPDAAAWWQLCVNPPVAPHTPYVWFDSPEAVGNDRVASTAKLSILRTTVDVSGVRITVADNNFGEREAIVGTIQPAGIDGNGCPTTFPTGLYGRALLGRTRIQPLASIGVAQNASVCLYQRMDKTLERPIVVASALLSARQARSTQLALASTPALKSVPLAGCFGSTVVLRFHGEHRDTVVEAQMCSGYISDGGGTRQMTVANTRPWLAGAVRSSLIGNDDSGVIRHFNR
jgi:hypothetical protein